MRVAANEQVWLFFLQDALDLGHVVPRITADMGHVDIDIFHMEKQVFGILQAHGVVVDVAMNRPQRLEVGQSLSRLDVAQIASVPQLVNVLEEVEKLWHEGTMGIG